MSEEAESIYPRIIDEKETDRIYQDLAETVKVYKIDKFKEHIINKAVILIDTKEDMVDFTVKTIDDEIEILKEYNKEKKFVVFSEEMIEKVKENQEFYTIIIQPYLFVQLKSNRDDFIKSLSQENEESEEDAQENESQEGSAESKEPND